MNDLRITLPRNALMPAQREDVVRRGESVAAQRDERMSFDATLQRSAMRAPSVARPNDSNSALPTAAAADTAREAGSTPARPSAAASMPPAPAARTTMPEEDNRSMQPPAHADGDSSLDAADNGRAAGTASDAIDAATLRQASDAWQTSDGAAANAVPLSSDPSLTAGLVAVSQAIGSAAPRASAEPLITAEGANVAESVPAGTDPIDSLITSIADGGMTGHNDVDTAMSRTALELSAELTRSPVRDPLMQDFEQRFENSLARAVGTPGGTSGGTSPLLLAGLPPQPPSSQPAVPMAHTSIATPLSHPSFGDDLAHRVLLFAGQRLQSAEISLTPADLGPIRVSLELRGQEASVQFNATHAATRSAIEDALPRLREMLAAQGLQLAQTDVGDRAPRDPRGPRGGEADRPQPGVADARAAALGAAVDASTTGAVGARRVGLIDIRV